MRGPSKRRHVTTTFRPVAPWAINIPKFKSMDGIRRLRTGAGHHVLSRFDHPTQVALAGSRPDPGGARTNESSMHWTLGRSAQMFSERPPAKRSRRDPAGARRRR